MDYNINDYFIRGDTIAAYRHEAAGSTVIIVDVEKKVIHSTKISGHASNPFVTPDGNILIISKDKRTQQHVLLYFDSSLGYSCKILFKGGYFLGYPQIYSPINPDIFLIYGSYDYTERSQNPAPVRLLGRLADGKLQQASYESFSDLSRPWPLSDSGFIASSNTMYLTSSADVSFGKMKKESNSELIYISKDPDNFMYKSQYIVGIPNYALNPISEVKSDFFAYQQGRVGEDRTYRWSLVLRSKGDLKELVQHQLPLDIRKTGKPMMQKSQGRFAVVYLVNQGTTGGIGTIVQVEQDGNVTSRSIVLTEFKYRPIPGGCDVD